MKAIFANAGHNFWIDVAYQLTKQHDWEVPYLVGSGSVKGRALSLFPQAIFHTNNEAKANLVPIGCETIPQVPVDSDVLAGLAQYQHLLLKMCDRMNADGSYTLQKRVFYYHWQVAYWLRVLKYFKPDIVIFRTAPHQPYFFALYAVARYLKIKTLMFERTAIPGLVLPVSSYEDGSSRLHKKYRDSCDTAGPKFHSEAVSAYLQKMQGGYAEAMPSHLKYRLSRHSGGELPNARRLATDTLWGMMVALGQRGKIRTSLRKEFYKTLGARKKKKLRDYYMYKAECVDLRQPYIFVALQCEPERQAVPAGGWFSDQYLMVELLSNLAPSGWSIYVKEHVSQYKSYQHGELSRTREFYDRLDGLPNVTLVPLSFKSFDLIDNAKASATVSGSVAWESVVRARPALLFGYAWYQGCEGVFHCASMDIVATAIEKIAAGYRPDREKVARFLQCAEETGVKGFIDELYMEMSIKTEHDYQNNVRAFVEAISCFY